MMGLLDVASRLPINSGTRRMSRPDQRFWERILAAMLPGTLLLLDLGFTNYTYYVRLMALQVTFITRCKSNAAYQIKQVLLQEPNHR
ncbi:MAG: hypothetical protein R3A44_06310 [Caldilineaceae bacterium]